MFLVSLKSLKGKFILLLAAVVAAIIVCVIVARGNTSGDSESISQVNALNYSALTSANQLEFINSLGYTVKTEPDAVNEITIPSEFDSVYTQYNEIQQEAGLDLTPYKGCTAKKWTYTITNYPEYKNQDCIKINLIIYAGRIIGGDICSVELDGFMTGLIKCP